ncbi:MULTISPECIES: L7Ae/L30e/S12e/Gadd45 family ribosomal protein [Lactobacillaceae]|uniref:L7Ae/L30e/S12e/Gadd45 family ribosomal protein n=1 Tax=Lactobacillaceae TaxID=33958 RepID=UPI000C1B6A38|nr:MULTISPECIES: ribosomal L7Ae/L30e/S12e/Gadd45 family protein [Lactobacillaceae]
MKNEFLNLLGIANRARKIIGGTEITIDGVRNHSVKLIIMGSDCSDRTKKEVNNKATFYKVPVVDQFSSEEIIKSIGRKRKVIGITDAGFAKRLVEITEK